MACSPATFTPPDSHGKPVPFEHRHERYMNVAEVMVTLASASLVFVPSSRLSLYSHACVVGVQLEGSVDGHSVERARVEAAFNGDGKLDMAVSDSQQGTGSSVLVFPGNGDGTMQAPLSTTVTGLAHETFMATADFKKDNHLDLVVADQNNSHVVVLLGNETEVSRVRVGQRAYVTADAFAGLQFLGHVVRVGEQLGRKNVQTDEPTERVDTKVLETLVELDKGAQLPVGLRVDAFIVSDDPQVASAR